MPVDFDKNFLSQASCESAFRAPADMPATAAPAFTLSAEIHQPSLAAGIHAAMARNAARNCGYGNFGAPTYSVSTRAGYGAILPARTMPNSQVAAAQDFIGKSWSMGGDWGLATIVAAEVGASLSIGGTHAADRTPTYSLTESESLSFSPPDHAFVDVAAHKMATAAYEAAGALAACWPHEHGGTEGFHGIAHDLFAAADWGDTPTTALIGVTDWTQASPMSLG